MRENDSDEGSHHEARWLTVAELAKRYKLSIATVRHWLKTGKLDSKSGAHRIGNGWRINQVEFEAEFFDRHKNN